MKPTKPTTATEKIADRIIRYAVTLDGYTNGEIRRIISFINRDVEPDLVKQLQKHAGHTLTRKRIETMQTAVQEIIMDGYTQIRSNLTDDMVAQGKVDAKSAVKIIADSMPIEVDLVTPNAAVIRQMVKTKPICGEFVPDWFKALTLATQQKINRQIMLGVTEGEGIDKIIRRIIGTRANQYRDGVLERARKDVAGVVRTAVAGVSDNARDEVFRANSDLIKAVCWTATLDSRTCPSCMSLDGQTFDLDKGPHAPAHWNCLPGDSLVLARNTITGATKRWYDGEVVVIRTASGRELTCTPNHPILTDTGWVPAGRLNVGCNVVCDGGREWKSASLDNDNENVPATIHDVAEAFFRSGKVVPMPVPVSPPDFHGDGGGSEVAIVAAKGFLSDRVNTPVLEHRPQLDFGITDFEVSYLSRLRDQAAGFLGMLFAPDGRVSSLCYPLPLFCCHTIHAGLLLFGSVSRSDASSFYCPQYDRSAVAQPSCDSSHTNPGLIEGQDFVHRWLDKLWRRIYAVLGQDSVYHLMRNAKRLRDAIGRFAAHIPLAYLLGREVSYVAPDLDSRELDVSRDGVDTDIDLAADILSGAAGPVFLDEIVDLRFRKWSGHVYNLETMNHFYTAQGIITHNCRCSRVPVLKSWKELAISLKEAPEGTRASMDGQVPASLTYGQWLKQQSTEVQDEALGKTRAGLFRSGKVEIDEFVSDTRKVLTLADLEKAIVKKN